MHGDLKNQLVHNEKVALDLYKSNGMDLPTFGKAMLGIAYRYLCEGEVEESRRIAGSLPEEYWAIAEKQCDEDREFCKVVDDYAEKLIAGGHVKQAVFWTMDLEPLKGDS